MEVIVRDWDYWAYLFRVTHRERISKIEAYDNLLIDFVVAALALKPGDELLDLASGSGVHGVRLAKTGISVTGVDISPSLVAYANQLVDENNVEGVAFIVGDMRDPPCASTFDAVTILSHSFGFFGREGDRAVLHAIKRALRPGGRFLLDLNEPSSLEAPRQSWQELDGGYLLSQASYDPLTCTRASHFRYIDAEGRVNVAEEPERIRIYTLPELVSMIEAVGLNLDAVYGRMELPLTRYNAECRERQLVVGSKSLA
jgi:SAM-dependent methyltransferase